MHNTNITMGVQTGKVKFNEYKYFNPLRLQNILLFNSFYETPEY